MRPPAEVSVREIRERLRMRQWAVVAQFGFSHGAIKNWAQGRRRPDVAARGLLTFIDHEPEVVRRALQPLRSRG
jgi:putative transcriptional regulator